MQVFSPTYDCSSYFTFLGNKIDTPSHLKLERVYHETSEDACKKSKKDIPEVEGFQLVELGDFSVKLAEFLVLNGCGNVQTNTRVIIKSLKNCVLREFFQVLPWVQRFECVATFHPSQVLKMDKVPIMRSKCASFISSVYVNVTWQD